MHKENSELSDVVVKPPKMPQKAWDFQLKVNKQLGRNLYTPSVSFRLTKSYK